jgi:hypothetical protein
MKTTVQVTKRALVQRINRKLPSGRRLVSARGAKEIESFGNFYIATTHSKGIELHEKNVDLQAYGRKIGVLEDWEVLANAG